MWTEDLKKSESAGLRAQKTMMTSKGFVLVVVIFLHRRKDEERRNAGFLDRQSIYVKQNV